MKPVNSSAPTMSAKLQKIAIPVAPVVTLSNDIKNSEVSKMPVMTVLQGEGKSENISLFPQTESSVPVNNSVFPLSIQDIQNKAEKLHLLSNKYAEYQAKLKELERFEISHVSDNAQMSIIDSNGLSFESSNPKSIAQVIEIWKTDFQNAIKKTESSMRELIGA